jgi:hypothetical protein
MSSVHSTLNDRGATRPLTLRALTISPSVAGEAHAMRRPPVKREGAGPQAAPPPLKQNSGSDSAMLIGKSSCRSVWMPSG